jgi:hypothetical protein
MINKEGILKQNSEFGYLLDFHREEMPPHWLTDDRFREEFDTPRKESYNFLKACANNSQIYTMTIKRKRLESFSSINNAASVADYTSYDNNEVAETLVSISNSNDRPSSSSDEKATIEEWTSGKYSKIGVHSFFHLKDFDLYRNITHGRYRYTVEIAMVDGVKKYLRDFYTKYFKAVKGFERYVTEASKPYIRAFRPEDDNDDNLGSYDYEREEFSERFKFSREFDPVIVEAVMMYMKASYLFNKRTSFFTKSFREELHRMLQPDSADIGNLKMFLDLLHKVGNSIKQRIFKNGTDIEKTLNLGTHKRRVGAGNQTPNGLIAISSDLAGSVKVESKNSVFYTVGEDPSSEAPEVTEFFTLQSSTQRETFAQSESSNSEVEDPVKFNSAGETVNRNTIYSKRIIGPFQDNHSEIISATEYSEYGESYDDNTSDKHTNPLNSHNLTANNFGGTSFNYLLTKTLSLSETSTNECGEEVNTVSPTIERSIFDSIVSTDNRENFLEEVEEQYKGYHFTKESLGNLYDFIKHSMSNKDILKSMSTDQTESKLQKYKYRVERGISTENHKSQLKKLKREKLKINSSMLTDLYVYTISEGFVLESTKPEDSVGIFERRPKGKIKTSSGKKPVITKSVYISQAPLSPGNSRPIGRSPSPITHGPTRSINAGVSAPIGGSTRGGDSGGY